MKIREWLEIAKDFKDTLVLGNGASIAIHNGFNYPSLLQKAREECLITEELKAVFSEMKTEDFELVLRYLGIAQYINTALKVADGKTLKASQAIKDALINTVRKVHPDQSDVRLYLVSAYKFMQKFETVISLNYDLLVYWSMMLGNDELGKHFKDCFVDGHFKDDWCSLRSPCNADRTTLVFYPHGNLALAVDSESVEFKITSNKNSSTALLDLIVETWTNSLQTPLFVAEGDSDKKLKAIRRSRYLSTVYDDVLSVPKETGDTVAIYGWSLNDKDKHILEKICKDKKMIAVSVYQANGSNSGTESYHSVEEKISGINKEAEIIFYNAESPGCWIQGPSVDSEANFSTPSGSSISVV